MYFTFTDEMKYLSGSGEKFRHQRTCRVQQAAAQSSGLLTTTKYCKHHHLAAASKARWFPSHIGLLESKQPVRRLGNTAEAVAGTLYENIWSTGDQQHIGAGGHMLCPQQPSAMQAATSLRSLLLCPSLLRAQATHMWARPRLLTSLRDFRTPATSSVIVKMQPHAQMPRRGGPAAASAIDSPPAATARSFADLGISSGLQAAMAEYELTEPTDIQVRCPATTVRNRNPACCKPYSSPRRACPDCLQDLKQATTFAPSTLHVWHRQVAAFQEVMRGGDVMLASHTGSGKTLAYLLPLVRLHIPAHGQPGLCLL